MQNSYEHKVVKPNRKYDNFLTFVVLTVSLRMFDFFEKYINNNYIGWASTLVFFIVILALISKVNLSLKLRKLCERLKINIFMLYGTYIIIHFIIFMFIFKLD
ncbi:hypothetical protein A2U94_15055 [Bacillus sp. VT 712]|uniref:Uncharacterized protein n=1 Tax=Priestia veravalensis TaxID=1414648 RepID=A0A0V8JPB6_9BACI|nr:hypothetical protein AS180_05200 [Priestia veravalensis]KZB90606.1 hypothetical protein A2U94_15055 [Bacillus sp. VT 712]SCC02444.1 hypothetical protein GA0061087_100828 [Priestia flexa]